MVGVLARERVEDVSFVNPAREIEPCAQHEPNGLAAGAFRSLRQMNALSDR
jgi:hypothetical protein